MEGFHFISTSWRHNEQDIRAFEVHCPINSTIVAPTGNFHRMTKKFRRPSVPTGYISAGGLALLSVPLSFRDIEGMRAKRGINASFETIRRWILKFGQEIAVTITSRRGQASGCWFLDEVFVLIADRRKYLCRP